MRRCRPGTRRARGGPARVTASASSVPQVDGTWLSAPRAGTACRAVRRGWRRARAHSSDHVREGLFHAPEVEQLRPRAGGPTATAETAIMAPGRGLRAQQRPAEALHHARHRVQPVQRPPAAPAPGCWDRPPAWRTSRTASGTAPCSARRGTATFSADSHSPTARARHEGQQQEQRQPDDASSVGHDPVAEHHPEQHARRRARNPPARTARWRSGSPAAGNRPCVIRFALPTRLLADWLSPLAKKVHGSSAA